MGLMDDVIDCKDAPSNPFCATTDVQLQATLELIGSLAPVREYTFEAARELAIVERRSREIAELIERELDQ